MTITNEQRILNVQKIIEEMKKYRKKRLKIIVESSREKEVIDHPKAKSMRSFYIELQGHNEGGYQSDYKEKAMSLINQNIGNKHEQANFDYQRRHGEKVAFMLNLLLFPTIISPVYAFFRWLGSRLGKEWSNGRAGCGFFNERIRSSTFAHQIKAEVSAINDEQPLSAANPPL